VNVLIDLETGKMRVFRARQVVAEVEDETTQFTIDQAKPYKADASLGDLVEYEELDGDAFGRIGAQTAKQVVLQRLREAEREVVFGQYADRESEIITGVVSRVEPRGVILDVGRAEAILATTDQSASESYRIGQHVKAYVLEVRRTTKGPLIYVSRTHKNFLRRLFELEVPEIHAGTVEIKAIAREAGSRSKVAVAGRQEGLDPVGATVGQRGGRVQSVVAELTGEKIDVIPWSDDPAVFVANALSPAQVVSVTIDQELRIANVTVPERMLSLAIGREGQNARLAAKLTGWRIDIRSDQSPPKSETAPERPSTDADPVEAVAVDTADAPAPDAEAPVAKPRAKRVTKAAAAAEVAASTDAGAPDEAPPAAPDTPAKRVSKAKAAPVAATTAEPDTPAAPAAAKAKAPAKRSTRATATTAAPEPQVIAETPVPAKKPRATSKKTAQEVTS
ncbi:MAG: transcription termination factor NusA, partial [Candidatus Limnocylindrales bacterium]